MMNNVIQAEIPEQLSEQAQMLIQRGWASSLQEIINESLRRYLESHQEVLTEAFIQEDVEWGLHGDD
jgi:Arc/MetJ-type ribon-helix-helix transcriptional regulator